MPLPVRHREEARRAVPQRRDPFRQFEDLQQLTFRLMQDALSGQIPTPEGVFTPLVDIEETDDAWIIEAELPGVRREDVNVEVDGAELAITGEIKERERTGILRRRTRPVGRFEYRVTLPSAIDSSKIDANLKDGILTVRVPKPENARPRRIEVQTQEPREAA
jgi:HSP20 family protein